VLGAALLPAVLGAALLTDVGVEVGRAAPNSVPVDQVDALRHRAWAGYGLFALAGAVAIVDIALWVRWARRAPAPLRATR
jgi:hypothetical protein